MVCICLILIRDNQWVLRFATVLMVGATAYIADISEKEERAFRIGEKPTVTRSVAETKLI